MESKIAIKCLLNPAHQDCGYQTYVKLSPKVRISLFQQRLKLWPMMHDDNQVVIAVKIREKVVSSKPWRATIVRVLDLEIGGQILQPAWEVFIVAYELGIKRPVLFVSSDRLP